MPIDRFYWDDEYAVIGDKGRYSITPIIPDYRVYDRKHSSIEPIAFFKNVSHAETFCETMNALLPLRDSA